MSQLDAQCLELLNPGGCLTKVTVWVKENTIIKCDLQGKCHGNLRVIAESLIGESINNAVIDVSFCGKHSQSCSKQLEMTLKTILIDLRHHKGVPIHV